MADSPSSGETPPPPPQVEKGWKNLMQHCAENKVQVGMWATRIFTILFTIGYIIPLFGNPQNAYYKALISSAATNALRLHQRAPRVQFNTQFVEMILLEDSCHYFLYSLIFLYVSPVTLVLAPIVLFAIIHSSSYSLTLLDCLGHNSWWGARFLVSLVEFQARKILQFCAISELLVMPLSTILVFTGRAGLFTPFIYYQFLKMRLASRRNSTTRMIFYELQRELTAVSAKPSMPRVVSWIINFLLTVSHQMIPAGMQQQQQQQQQQQPQQ